MIPLTRPDASEEMHDLKDFQRTTVEYVHRRLYLDSHPTRRFLVADEVGLGKTLVARGVIARAIEHMWDTVDRIDILYVCSNAAIAQQNLKRLLPRWACPTDFATADRLTFLASSLPELARRKVNFISFTPGTSFNMRSSMGVADERRLLFHLLREEWGFRGVAPMNVLQGKVVNPLAWRASLGGQSRHLEPSIRTEFHALLGADPEIRERFNALCDRFARVDSTILATEWHERGEVIGCLRRCLAQACLRALEPDLIILDEFQRFKDLMTPGNPVGDLAAELFAYEKASTGECARTLLLSATPYRMLTRADETDQDHYTEFVSTVGFLEGAEGAASLKRLVAAYRRDLFALGTHDAPATPSSRVALEQRLQGVMSRTERVRATEGGDGMLVQHPTPALEPREQDVRAYCALQMVADHADVAAGNALGYWKSIPYPLNFMDDYDLRKRFDGALVHSNGRDLVSSLTRRRALFPAGAVEAYEAIDPMNGKMRQLADATVGAGAWQLLWLPATAPYYTPSAPFSSDRLKGFTKRLVFSAWTAVPRAVASLLSYEAERSALRASRDRNDPPVNTKKARETFRSLLTLRLDEGRAASMNTLTLLYPSLVLASELDPLAIAAGLRSDNGGSTPSLAAVLRSAKKRAEGLLASLPDGDDSGPEDKAWYWAAPMLLDEAALGGMMPSLLAPVDADAWQAGDAEDGEPVQASATWRGHVETARDVVIGKVALGRRPADLATVLAETALGGPGVIALRALSRATGITDCEGATSLQLSAGQMAFLFRGLYSTPEAHAVLRAVSRRRDGAFWRQALRYGMRGCLQAVLDEYLHVIPPPIRPNDTPASLAVRLVEEVASALGLRTGASSVTHISTRGAMKKVPMRLHFARRLADDAPADAIEGRRLGKIQDAFNSPFWPFVLVSTSIGQEGLDFHRYCHAVVHWDLPHNPVDMEQREGRVHRYKGHAVRKNVAARHAPGVLSDASVLDPWSAMFAEALRRRHPGANDIVPFWIYEGAAKVERHVPLYPVSRDAERLVALRRALAVYRMVFGQPRQEDLLDYLAERLSPEKRRVALQDWQIDLRPAPGSAPPEVAKGPLEEVRRRQAPNTKVRPATEVTHVGSPPPTAQLAITNRGDRRR